MKARRKVWPLGLAASEGLATAKAGRWTSTLLVGAIAWLVAIPAIVDARAVEDLVEAEQTWVNAGGWVIIADGQRNQDQSINPIPAGSCERLNDSSGVKAAFALWTSGTSGSLTHIPGGRASIYHVTPGAFSFFGASPGLGPTFLATSNFAERSGITDGGKARVVIRDSIHTQEEISDYGTFRIVNSEIMGEEYEGSVLVPTVEEDQAERCFVFAEPGTYQSLLESLPGSLNYEGKPAQVSTRLYQSEFTVDYTTAFEDRDLRWIWVPAAALIVLLWAMVQWFRRSHLAIYTTFGMTAPSRLMLQVSEWLTLAGIGLVAGWSLGIIGATVLDVHTSHSIPLVTSHALLTVLAATVGVVLLGLRPTGTLLHALKDR